MAGVARRHAVQVSCPVVVRDLFLVRDADKRLFEGIDRDVMAGLQFGHSFEVEAMHLGRPRDAVPERADGGRSSHREAGLHQRLLRLTVRGPGHLSRPGGRARLRGSGGGEPGSRGHRSVDKTASEQTYDQFAARLRWQGGRRSNRHSGLGMLRPSGSWPGQTMPARGFTDSASSTKVVMARAPSPMRFQRSYG